MPKTFPDLRRLRYPILLAALVFLAGAVLGARLTDLPDAMIQPLFELARQLRGKPWASLAVLLFCKNALAALVAILGGFLLGLLPLAAAFANGMVLGRVAVLQPGNVWLLVPHGIFEITAVTIAWGAGLWCAGWLFRPPRGKRLRQRAVTSLQLYGKLVLPLLAVAAAIEAAGITLLTGP